jgi:hypothetical protein
MLLFKIGRMYLLEVLFLVHTEIYFSWRLSGNTLLNVLIRPIHKQNLILKNQKIRAEVC